LLIFGSNIIKNSGILVIFRAKFVKLWNFVNFGDNYHKNSRILIIFPEKSCNILEVVKFWNFVNFWVIIYKLQYATTWLVEQTGGEGGWEGGQTSRHGAEREEKKKNKSKKKIKNKIKQNKFQNIKWFFPINCQISQTFMKFITKFNKITEF